MTEAFQNSQPERQVSFFSRLKQSLIAHLGAFRKDPNTYLTDLPSYTVASTVEYVGHKISFGHIDRKIPWKVEDNNGNKVHAMKVYGLSNSMNQVNRGQNTSNTSGSISPAEATVSPDLIDEAPENARKELLGATLRTAANALIIGMDLFPGVGYIADTLEAVNWGLRTTSIVYPSFRNFNLTPDMGGKGMMVGLGAQALDFAVLGGMAPGSASSIILHGGQIYYDLGLIKKHIINPLDFLKVGINRLRNRNTDTGEEDTN
jgi:hypothetical protein